jgi:hypothetical protein
VNVTDEHSNNEKETIQTPKNDDNNESKIEEKNNDTTPS